MYEDSKDLEGVLMDRKRYKDDIESKKYLKTNIKDSESVDSPSRGSLSPTKTNQIKIKVQ